MDYKLMSDEKVIIESRTHWAAFAVPPGSILAGVLIAVLSVLIRKDQSTPCIWWLAIPGILLFLAGCRGILPSIDDPRTEFALTDRRIIASKGLFRRRSIELLLSQVKGVELRQPVGGQLFNYGDVVLTVANAKNERFHNLAGAAKIKEQISSMITGQV
jgi:hypothetical protein